MKILNTAIVASIFGYFTHSQLRAAEMTVEIELSRLRLQHQKAFEAASKPIEKRYQASLEVLQKKATQANDLDTALQIRNELANITLRLALTGTAWSWDAANGSSILRFNPGGRMLSSGFGEGVWVVTGPDIVTIYSADAKTVLRFNETRTTYSGSDFNQKRTVKGMLQK